MITVDTATRKWVEEMIDHFKLDATPEATEHIYYVVRRHVDACHRLGIFSDAGEEQLIKEAYDDYLDLLKTGNSILTWKMPDRPITFWKYAVYQEPEDVRI